MKNTDCPCISGDFNCNQGRECPHRHVDFDEADEADEAFKAAAWRVLSIFLVTVWSGLAAVAIVSLSMGAK